MRYIRLISVVLITICGKHSMAQSFAINTDGSSAHTSAILDIKSNNQGLLIPRLSSAQRTGIVTPATGLQVYDTDLNLLYFFNGTTWSGITPGTNYWTVSGSNLFNNTGTKVGIGTSSPSAKLHVGGGTRFTVMDTGAVFLQSGNTIGSARDWKMSVTLPNGYLSFRDMGFDNLNNGMANDAMVIQWGTGNVGIGTAIPGDKLEVNGNIRLTGTGTFLAGPSTTGSAYSVTVRAGDPYVPVGGSGGNVNIIATNNMPSGGSGYGNLGPSGNINLTAASGYNTAGGNINIIAGATSCWSLSANAHADVNIRGGANLVSADAASIAVEGGGTVGVGCPTANANGGNLVFRSGIGTGSGTQGNIQLMNGNVGIGTSAPSQKLHVVGNICYTGGIAACSDARFKTNITPLQNSLNKLMQLQGVHYLWNTGQYTNMNFSENLQIGFIAQDLEKVFPEMVFTDDKGYRSIDYSRLTPVLVETIKEQQQQLTDLTSRLNAIEKMLAR